MKPVILALIADTHPNSMVGLCPKKGVYRTDGDTKSKYTPGKVQSWLWECYEDIINNLRKLKKKMRCELWSVKVGDGSDDNTHSKHGLITVLTDEIVDISYQCDEPLLGISDRLFIVHGTPAHVGQGGSLEKLAAQRIVDKYAAGEHKCQVVRGTVGYTRWCWQFRASGIHVLCKHKSRSATYKPWTRGSGANRMAVDVADECREMGWPVPDVAYYGHYHYPADSGENHKMRVFYLPCMKLHGSWEESRGFRAEPVGIRVAVCDNGRFEPQPLKEWIYYPKGDEIWEP